MHTSDTVTPAQQDDVLLKILGAKMTSPPKIVKKKDGVIRQLRENTFLAFYELDSGDRIALTRIMNKILGGKSWIKKI